MRIAVAGLFVLLTACGRIPGTQANLEARAKAALRSSLLDAEAARFQKLVAGASGTLCGEVNAKNSFGAYTGYSRFISNSGKAAFDPKFPQDKFTEIEATARCKAALKSLNQNISEVDYATGKAACVETDRLINGRREQEAFDRAFTGACSAR